MAIASSIGLVADLNPWRAGMRNARALVQGALNSETLKDFNASASRGLAGLRAGFSSVFGGLRGLIAAAGIGTALYQMKRILGEAYAEYQKFEDSTSVLRAALQTLDPAMRAAFDSARFATFRQGLREALGVAGADVNLAMADFITRGFDTEQARQLTMLAANYAAKTGQPLANVAKTMADAANGNVRSMKELGVQIASTGNLVTDGTNAVLALKAAYGGVGAELVDPSDRLRANMQELYVTLGEKIAPILDPLIQGAADFVAGLTASGEGRAILDEIAQTFQTIVTFAQQAVIAAEGVFVAIRGGVRAAANAVLATMGAAFKSVLDLATATPAIGQILRLLGVDLDGVSALNDEFIREAIAKAKAGWEEASRGAGMAMSGEGGIAKTVSSVTEAGRRVREQRQQELQDEFNRTKGVGFAGQVAKNEEAQKEAERLKRLAEERKRAEEKQLQEMERLLEKQASARAPVSGGTVLKLVNTRGNPLGGLPLRNL